MLVRMVLGLMLVAASSFAAETDLKGKLLREVWSELDGGGLNEMTKYEFFPNFPSSAVYLNAFERPTNWADSYGQRVRGLVTPRATGDYPFWIASDDQSVLYISES